MKAKEFKEAVIRILNQDIKFEGHVEKVAESITEHRQEKILDWIKECKEGIQRPEPCTNFRNLISFIYKSNDNRIRCILTKEKESYFIELFIDKHKYYDRKRKYLGL